MTIAELRLSRGDRWTGWLYFVIFRVRRGSRHIATPFALAHLSAVLRSHPPMRVLEYGAGIGTMTRMLLARGAEVVAIEDNAWCRAQLLRNIPQRFASRLTVIAGPEQASGPFDLTLIDGEVRGLPARATLAPGAVVFAEGTRSRARRDLPDMLAAHGLTLVVNDYKPARIDLRWDARMRWHWWPRRSKRGDIRWARFRSKPAKGCWIATLHNDAARHGLRHELSLAQ